jgi:hypothetical protein
MDKNKYDVGCHAHSCTRRHASPAHRRYEGLMQVLIPGVRCQVLTPLDRATADLNLCTKHYISRVLRYIDAHRNGAIASLILRLQPDMVGDWYRDSDVETNDVERIVFAWAIRAPAQVIVNRTAGRLVTTIQYD